MSLLASFGEIDYCTDPLVPAQAQGCPGKLGIAEFDLIWGETRASFGGMDFGRLVDPGDGFSGEDAGFDEFGEADGGDGAAAVAGGDAQEQISDHGGDDLETNGVFAAAKEFAQAQMLL